MPAEVVELAETFRLTDVERRFIDETCTRLADAIAWELAMVDLELTRVSIQVTRYAESSAGHPPGHGGA